MQILVKTYRRQQRSRATIYVKPLRITWEAGREYSYTLRLKEIEFLKTWPTRTGSHREYSQFGDPITGG
jgi:hypothetical protein